MVSMAGSISGRQHGSTIAEWVERIASFDVLDWIFHFESGDEETDDEEIYGILEEAGIDSFEWDYMDDEERVLVLEEAGLDPFDFGL